MSKYQVLTDIDAQTLRQVISWWGRQRADLRPPAMPVPVFDYDDTVWILNDTGLAIPEGGLVVLDGATAKGLISAQRPWTVGHSQIGIAVADIAAGEEGRAWIDGDHYLDNTDLSTTYYGDRVGTQKDDFHAIHDLLGPLMMLEASYGGATRLLARFIHERGDGVLVEDKT